MLYLIINMLKTPFTLLTFWVWHSTNGGGPNCNFIVRHNFTCTSSNIIYCISRHKCSKLYIGETGRRLSDRFAEHLRSVRTTMLTSLSPGISTALTILFQILQFVPSHPSPVAMIATRDRKGVSFSNLEQLLPRGSTNVFLLFNHLISFCFCLAWADRNISLYTVFPWFCFHFYRMQISIPLGSLTVSPCAGLVIAVENSK